MMKKINKILLVIIFALLSLGILAGVFIKDLRQMLYFSALSEHESSYLESFYTGRNVLFLVPHEDDEYNLGGGIIEQYVDAGSKVSVCYLTNGDAYGGGDKRIEESVSAMAELGLGSENLYFLGYGDTWDISDEYSHHIYQAPADEVFPSANGKVSTYGTEKYPDFHTMKYGESAAYTRDNIKSDISDVIDMISPDTIFCIECDKHPDHRALSLLFEEVLGEKLKGDSTYHPDVYKGFGYSTGWDGVRDYYADNVVGVKNPFDTDIMEDKCILTFSDRLRFPVAAKTLAPTEHASSAYPVLAAFASQDALFNFECLVNSDKVFWERNTNSVLYNSTISTDGDGNMDLLTDFKLADTSLIDKKKNSKWNEGNFVLKEGQSVTFELSSPRKINCIKLYDFPFEDNDILDMLITFDDGEEIKTGALPANGSAKCIEFDDKIVSKFTIKTLKASGETPGLIEVEAFDLNQYYSKPGFIKLVCNDDFMYDYYMKKGQQAALSCYSYPDNIQAEIFVDGNKLDNLNFIYDGRSHIITAKSLDGVYYDEAVIKPLTMYRKILVKLARYIEKKIL